MSTSIAARIAAFERGEPLRPADSPPSPASTALPAVIPPTPRAGSPASSPVPIARSKAPPLPPRKPSIASLRSTASVDLSNPPPLPSRSASDSLSVQHTYPPTKKGKHAHAASTSSFQSVSLSSDGGEQDDRDHDSLDGSFESVPSSIPTSTSIPSSPASDTLSLNGSSRGPKLPLRPWARSSPAHSATSLPASPSASLPSSPPLPAQDRPVISRRPAPPPPIKTPKAGELRAATAYPPMHTKNGGPSSVAAKRPTPVPPAARTRYNTLFERNMAAQRDAVQAKGTLRPPRRADGWRGLSIDWTGDDDGVKAATAAEERLRGGTVKVIWSWSRLSRERLKQIWDEVNPGHHDGLTRDAFASGMWRIDEELTRAAAKESTRGSGARKPAPPLPSRKITR